MPAFTQYEARNLGRASGMTFAQLQEVIVTAYPADVESDVRILLRFLSPVMKLMEIARKDDRKKPEALPKALAEIFKQWNIFAARIGVNLDDALWHKYPGVCPHCLGVSCACGSEHPHIPRLEEQLEQCRSEVHKKPHDLAGHQGLHRRLYGRSNSRDMPFQLMCHIAEEGGEVIDDFLLRESGKLADELADVGSWIFAVANRFGYDMAQIIEKYLLS